MNIKTRSGYSILADDADAELLSAYSWYVVKVGSGRLYAQARVPKSVAPAGRIKMHRLLMNPQKGLVVHHRNNDGLDNRRSNLEVTTQRQNIRYKYDGTDRGAHFHKQTGKWRAQARDENGRVVSLGLHGTKEAALEAAKTYRSPPSLGRAG